MFRENSNQDPLGSTSLPQQSRIVDSSTPHSSTPPSSTPHSSTPHSSTPRSSTIDFYPVAPRLLRDLNRGQRIRLVRESVPESHRPLLEAMGLCNDCDLHLCQSRGTCILDIDGSRVGISEQVASSILAIPVPS